MQKINLGLATLTSFLVLIFLMQPITQVPIAKADSNQPLTFSSGLTIYSPLNKTYSSNLLLLNLTFGSGAGLQTSLNYSIDGEYQEPITLTFNSTTGFHFIYLGYGLVQLPEFSNGQHVLTVNVEANLNDYHGANPPGAPFKPVAPNSSDYFASWVHTIYFTVDASEAVPTSSSPTRTPTVPELSWLAILPLMASLLLIAVLIKHRRTLQQ